MNFLIFRWPSNCYKACKADQQSCEVHPQNFVRSKWYLPDDVPQILYEDAKILGAAFTLKSKRKGIPALVRRQIIDLFCLHNRCQEELELLKEKMISLSLFSKTKSGLQTNQWMCFCLTLITLLMQE